MVGWCEQGQWRTHIKEMVQGIRVVVCYIGGQKAAVAEVEYMDRGRDHRCAKCCCTSHSTTGENMRPQQFRALFDGQNFADLDGFGFDALRKLW